MTIDQLPISNRRDGCIDNEGEFDYDIKDRKEIIKIAP